MKRDLRAASHAALLILLTVLMTLTATACTLARVGPRDVGDLAVAVSPAGSQVELVLTRSTLRGELLEVTREHVMVATPGEIVIVRYEMLRMLKPAKLPETRTAGRIPSESTIAQWRPLARFPAGIRPEHLTALLATHGQSEPRVLRASSGGGDSAAQFLQRARGSAERYRDRRVAVDEGFRQIGPDMPAMGEHWMQPGRMVSGRFDAAEPAVLTYITIDGAPVLTGVAFVLPLQRGQSPPDFPDPAAWHAHGGTVDEELLVALGPHGVNAMTASGVRLAMLHAWVFVDNPEGPFAGDNWALPFVRLGITPPPTPDRRAGQALFLARGGPAYFANLFHLTRGLSSADEAAADAALARAERAVSDLLAAHTVRDGVLSAAQLRALSTIWDALWHTLAETLSADGYAAIARFNATH